MVDSYGVRRARQTETLRPKLLTFTDNRWDASLQPEHFNNFLQVAGLRAGLYGALKAWQDLRFDDVAEAHGPRDCKHRLDPGTGL